ncbi:cholecystokinin receptor-like isoform X1 [Corythoichthys intestinalis]|uniref:cholecystokinin receptor-like isoform X1 n=1 Tax=Corythoichthys intestinalis TaxID=161448 RepID=UPI0025A5DC82|nr:cholecystokinin receptor-like isoform X1 [Corythoichthys intestinalis]
MSLQEVNVSLSEASGFLEQWNISVELPGLNVSWTNRSDLPKTTNRPKEMDTLRIVLYILIFLLSVFGNLLIIIVLILNKRMRTVTNSFLLSLAISDVMMAIFCMPFTLIPNILEDFIFGAAMCKTVAYFMGLSVSISTFSLVAIAIERYSAICNPLKSRAWQTRSHAYRVIAATWVLSLLIMIPYPVFSIIRTFPKANGTTGHMCRLTWPSHHAEQSWYVLLLLILFFIPGVVMAVAYGLISRELYRGMRFEMKQNETETTELRNGTVAEPNDGDDDGCYVQVSQKASSGVELPTLPTSSSSVTASSAATTAPKTQHSRSNVSKAKLEAKKRVIRMLLVIVALFFICWMPLYIANTWKAFDVKAASRALTGIPISFIHLLSYTSACVNPVIYCFMNTRFRKALLSTFACLCRNPLCRRCCPSLLEAGEEGTTAGYSMAPTIATSVSKYSYTTVSSTPT